MGMSRGTTALSVATLALGAAVFSVDANRILGDSLSGPERSVYLGLPVMALAALLALRLRTPSRPIGPDALGAFVVWMLVGAALGPNPGLSFWFVGAFAASALAARTLGRRDPIDLMTALTASLPATLGLFAVARLLDGSVAATDQSRLVLLSLEANQLARVAAVASLAGVFLAVEARSWPRRLFGAVVATGAIGLILMTGSRTSLIAYSAALGVVLVLRGSRRLVGTVALLGVAGTVTLLATSLGATVAQVMIRSQTRESAETLTGRTEIWPIVARQAMDRPIAGHGVGADRSIISGLSYTVGFEIQHSHNLILHLLMTTGIVGLVLFATVLSTSLARVPGGWPRAWVTGLGVFFVVEGLTEPVLQNPDAAWLALVAIVVLSEFRSETGDPDQVLSVSSDEGGTRPASAGTPEPPNRRRKQPQ